jgi:hypothetical protein
MFTLFDCARTPPLLINLKGKGKAKAKPYIIRTTPLELP